MDGQSVVGVFFAVGALVLGVLMLLLGRELVTWYWKVNAALEQLGRLEQVLRNIDKNLILMADLAQAQPPTAPHADAQQWGVKP